MELHILRHGIAEERSQSGKDRDRELTAEGREKTKAAGKALKRLGLSFDIVLSSPFARAWETAEIVVDQLDSHKLLHANDALSAGAPLTGVLKELAKASHSHASILIVGHEPDLSRLISVLISGGPDLAITMKKGGFAKLTCATLELGSARLDWLLTPKHLSALA